jgi:hypothetical protein
MGFSKRERGVRSWDLLLLGSRFVSPFNGYTRSSASYV